MTLERVSIVIDKKLWSDRFEDRMNALEQGLMNTLGKNAKIYPIQFEKYTPPQPKLPKIKYKVVNDTSYHEDNTDEMIKLLEKIRQEGIRCRFHWGNTETGEDWGDDCHVKGRIGRSTGENKIPLLIYNHRSYGGSALLDNCIVKITKTAGGQVLYEHPNYHHKPPSST